MPRLLCRNRVADYDTWWAVFSSHAEAHREAGLVLEHLWRCQEDPNDVYFVFQVTDMEKARDFMSTPEAGRAADESTLTYSEYHFVENQPGY
jgi:hypothetical protein